MTTATEGADVVIIAPYDSNVTSVVKEESVPVWESLGWKVKDSNEAQPAVQPARPTPVSAPAPTVAPNP